MRFARYRGERSLSELVERLYHVAGDGGRPRGERLRAAEAALVEANPQLQRPGVIAIEAPLRVPDVPGLDHTDESTSSADAAGEAGGLLAARLAALRTTFDAAASRRADAANATIDQARSAVARAAVRKQPALREQLGHAVEQARSDLALVGELRAFHASLVGKMAADAEALSSRLASELGVPPFG